MSYSYITCDFMVNLAHCTKITFDSQVIHIIHNRLSQIQEILSTPPPVHFRAKSSYAPTYPHYPQFFATITPFPPSIPNKLFFVKMS